jgi:hypothetical protein
MTTIIARAAESVHWYRLEDGGPQYTVEAKDGSDRPTTLSDARKMNLVPSVTTILKMWPKPGLEVWKNEQLLLAALTLPKRPDESEKDYIARIVYDSKETGKKAAERGTHIHESIEKWYRGDKKVDHPEMAAAFEEAVFKHFGCDPHEPFDAERSFANSFFGGKVDLCCSSSHSAPNGIVIDTKTKEFDEDDKVVAYDEMCMQLAAYRNGLGLTKARCANVFVSRNKPSLVRVFEWSEEELEKGWKMFSLLVQLWRIKNNFGEENAKPTGNK